MKVRIDELDFIKIKNFCVLLENKILFSRELLQMSYVGKKNLKRTYPIDENKGKKLKT
jgi:hypothetical protein